MVQLIKMVKNSSKKAGLKLNIKKTRVMSTGEQGNILVDGEEIRTVTSYKFSGALITNDGYIYDEIKRRISLGKAAMANLTKITKDSGVSTNTKVKLVQTIVFPAVLYGGQQQDTSVNNLIHTFQFLNTQCKGQISFI
jgi:ABC-type histidine transport system ATPase subunit